MPLEFIRNNDLSDPDGIDALLELASFVRSLIGTGRYEDIGILIRSIVENGYYEAFSWTMAGRRNTKRLTARQLPLNAASEDRSPITMSS